MRVAPHVSPLASILVAASLLVPSASAQSPELEWEGLPGPYGGYAAGVASVSDGSGFAAVATTTTRLYRSVDGVLWTPIALEQNQFGGLFTSPSGTFWALGSPLLRSDDRGLTWAEAGDGLPSGAATRLAAGPGEALYAATQSGLFRLAPGASLWTPAGLPGVVLDVAVTAEGVLMAGLSDGPGFAGFAVHRSSDGGATWTPVTLIPETYAAVSALVALPDGSVLAGGVSLPKGYAEPGLFRSTDGGVSWAALGALPDAQVSDFFLVRDVLYANTYADGTVRSADGGETWTPTGDLFSGLAEGPDGSTLAASNRLGILRSPDDGLTWQDATEGFGAAELGHVAVRADGLVVAARAADYGTGTGLYRSTDGGLSWARLRLSFDRFGLSDLHIDASGRLFAAPVTECNYTGCPPELTVGVYRSLDDGATWLPTSFAGPIARAHHLTDGPGGALWVTHRNVGAPGQPHLSRSLDGGATWEDRGPIPFVASFAVGPDGTLWAGSDQPVVQVARSTDAGASWTTVLAGAAGLRTGAMVVAGDGSVVVGVSGHGLLSPDDGQTWQTVDFGFEQSWYELDELLLSPDGTLFAGVGSGPPVLRSLDDGRTWDTASAGLPEARYTTDLDLDAEGVLWAAVGRGGLYRTTGSTFVGAAPGPDAAALALAASPNPSRTSAGVTLSLPAASHLTVAVYDVLGRRLRVLHDGPAAAGPLGIRLDTSALAPGTYVLRASAGTDSATLPIAVVR
jgi:photosystem II stability/assembly factor-like uncharacterized protein